MSEILTHNILNLREVAEYLRLPEEKIERQVLEGRIPGRRIGDEWRFLKSAVDDWLRSHDTRAILLSQAGSLADDETLDDLRLMIYSERGRPEEEHPDAYS